MEETLSNVYIFNNILNNHKDIELLRNTFSSLKCNVTEVKNQLYADLKEIVKTISNADKADFSRFKYFVIIVLDNSNEDEFIWITTDGKRFHLNGDLMTAMYANRSLEGKLRFSIIQTNRVSNSKPVLRKRNEMKCYPGKDIKYYATSTGCKLTHTWNPDLPSPFIRILCKAITENLTAQESILHMLNRISDKVADETGELPSKETNFEDEFGVECLRSATI